MSTPAIDPVVAPDVATEPHPVAHPIPQSEGDDTGVGDGFQPAQPQIREAGGFKRLPEVAGQQDQDEG